MPGCGLDHFRRQPPVVALGGRFRAQQAHDLPVEDAGRKGRYGPSALHQRRVPGGVPGEVVIGLVGVADLNG